MYDVEHLSTYGINMHSFDTSIKRLGFACKWAEINKKGEIASVDGLNTGGTTLAWANRNKRDVVEQKIIDVAKQNIINTHSLVKKVATLPKPLRMLRLTSDMFSFYTHDDYKDFWKSKYIQDCLGRWMAPIGETARQNDVRLSFHPDQFVVLASDRPEVVNKSIEEFEYHADMARFMGYGKQFQDIKINVHISGRKGPEGIREAYTRLSPEARNSITIENEENAWGLNECLTLTDLLPIVLDIHHNWVREGEYIETTDPRIENIIDSWRGVRPVIHYSVSREEYLAGIPGDRLPDISTLIESGYNKQKLRAHSDYYHNSAVNSWALTHTKWADVMCESKAKNMASFKLYEEGKKLNFF
jgi:UV DNA damage repair endonuclease